ncbi:hypothetical protein BpHYR1_016156 [Brachionus plicatilis]|uniref:Uncharacterized protein n=1 Tax=Brachionus plicatilis TaxID=10195 RepID=A0A3M7RPN6_BRAPC|nr:hypothetical protein BpHYR1_016156 [Brachionus plicatilis]
MSIATRNFIQKWPNALNVYLKRINNRDNSKYFCFNKLNELAGWLINSKKSVLNPDLPPKQANVWYNARRQRVPSSLKSRASLKRKTAGSDLGSRCKMVALYETDYDDLESDDKKNSIKLNKE